MFYRLTFLRCIRVFLMTFVLACLFQFILIGLFNIFPNKFDFYHAIIQRQKTNKLNFKYRSTNELVNEYFIKKQNDLLNYEKEEKILNDFYNFKAKNENQSNLILNFNWKNQLPYFFKEGNLYPKENDIYNNLAIWPDEVHHDRIINQLMYIPKNYNKEELNKQKKFKKILIFNSFYKFSLKDLPNGQNKFLQDNCPVNTCEILRDNSEAKNADAILFKEHIFETDHIRPKDQIWIFYNLESPSNNNIKTGNNLINWTATYRLDSDLVAPYAKFVLYSNITRNTNFQKNYLAGKVKKVAWFVSNCITKNKRKLYASQLKKHISVDIYGSCGNFKCLKLNAASCFKKLKNVYKFYLSFENSNCKDYITEKFYLNALKNEIIPIVLGPNYEDYQKVAPLNSFIHVDEFKNVEELSRFLNFLSDNSTFYNKFFEWKNTGEFINTYFWCRLCALLHAPLKPKTYENLSSWWKSSDTCYDSKH